MYQQIKSVLSIEKTVIFICMTLLLLPSVFSVTNFDAGFTIYEKRRKKAFPTEYVWSHPEDYYKSLSNWYDDHFGMRDFLIRLQHQIDYSIFGYSARIYFDNEGYLYMRDVIDNSQIKNEKYGFKDDYNFREISNSLRKLRDFLSHKGIALKLIVPPHKNEITGYRNGNVCRPIPNAYDRLDEALKAGDLSNTYISVKSVLDAANQIHPVFWRWDFHWNDWGAAVGFGEVVNSYGRDLGFECVYDLSNLDVKPVKELPRMHQFQALSILSPMESPESVTVNYHGLKFIKWIEYKGLKEGKVWKNPAAGKLGGKCLFIGDSFTAPGVLSYNNTSSGIVQLFDEAYLSGWDSNILQKMPEGISLIVLEMCEKDIAGLAMSIDNLTREK